MMWKIILGLSVIYLIFLIIQESKDFNWRDFTYNNQHVQTEVLSIGFVSSLTGAGALIGVQSLAAAQLAVDEINSNGGVEGKTLKLLIEDGKCTFDGGAQAAQRLVEQNVSAIVGGLCSDASLGMIDIIDTHHIPTISHCSSSTELSGISDYFFRVYPSDSFQGIYAADFIKNNLHIDRIAIVYLDNIWGESLGQIFAESFSGQGGTIVLEYSFTEDQDFDLIWAEIFDADIELVYFLGFDDGTIAAMNSLGQAKIDFILFGANGWDDADIWEQIDVYDNKVLYTAFDSSEYDNYFIEKIKNRGVYSVSSCIPQAYDAVNILAEVMVNDSADLSEVITKLQNIHYTKGVSKQIIDFDESGDIYDIRYVVKEISSL